MIRTFILAGLVIIGGILATEHFILPLYKAIRKSQTDKLKGMKEIEHKLKKGKLK